MEKYLTIQGVIKLLAELDPPIELKEGAIRQYYKEWTAGEKLAFSKEDTWKGHMVEGFISYCLYQEKLRDFKELTKTSENV